MFAGIVPLINDKVCELSTPLVVPVQPAATLVVVNRLTILVGLEIFSLLSGSVGKASVNAAPVIATPLGLVIAILNTLTASFATGLVKNILLTVGGDNTVKIVVLLNTPAAGVAAVVTPLAVLGQIPGVALVTATMTVQPPAGKLGTVKFNTVAPTTNPGELVTLVHVPLIVVEAMFMLVRVSVKFAFASATALLLASVKVRLLVPPGPIVVGLNALTIVGLDITVKLTGPAPVPEPICVVVTPLTLLGLTPRFVLVTCTVIVQPPGARLGIVKFKAVAPTVSAGVLITPAQVPPMAVDATLIFNNVSVKFALMRMSVLALPIVKMIVLVSPLPMLDGLNDFEIVADVSGGGLTIKFADAVALVLALVEVTVPVVLVMPGEDAVTVLVTCTLIVQPAVPPALKGIVMPLVPSEASFATLPDETVPPQVLLKFGTKNTFIPAGKLSVSAAPVIDVVVDGLVSVNVIVVGLLATMVPTLKLLARLGAAKRTTSGAAAATGLPPPSSVLRKPAMGDAGMVLV